MASLEAVLAADGQDLLDADHSEQKQPSEHEKPLALMPSKTKGVCASFNIDKGFGSVFLRDPPGNLGRQHPAQPAAAAGWSTY